jgi:hypothetical protein
VQGLGPAIASLRAPFHRAAPPKKPAARPPAPAGTSRAPPTRDADGLRRHYASEHHACTDPDCDSGLVAFATQEELKCAARAGGRAGWAVTG